MLGLSLAIILFIICLLYKKCVSRTRKQLRRADTDTSNTYELTDERNSFEEQLIMKLKSESEEFKMNNRSKGGVL